MFAALASIVVGSPTTPPEASSTSSPESGEKLWSLRRRVCVNATGENAESTSKAEDAQVDGSSTLGVSLHALRHSREDRCGTGERSSNLRLDRLSNLLQRFDAVDASNPSRLKIVGTFRRASYLLESSQKVMELLEVQQQGKDTNTLASLRDVFLYTESHLEELLFLCETSSSEHSATVDSSSDNDRLFEDDFTSDPWDDCEDICREDLLEFFTDSLEMQTNPETVIAKTPVEDLLKVCWQQGESLRASEKRVTRPLSHLVDLDLPCDATIGTGVDYSDCSLDKLRGSHGTASTASCLSAASCSSISLASTGSSVGSRWPYRSQRLMQVVEIGSVES